jgi:uncharacterized protein (TIGR04255 family)
MLSLIVGDAVDLGEIMQWTAVNDRHAIERIRVAFNFKEPLSQKIVSKIYDEILSNKVLHGFNGVDESLMSGIGLKVLPDGLSSPRQLEPIKIWNFQWKDEATSAILDNLSISPQCFVYESIAYERWADFLGKLLRILSAPLSSVNEVTDFTSIVIEYWDRFVFHGEKTLANPTDILKNLGGNIHEDALSGKMLWHLKRGWFENFENLMILVNHDAQAQDSVDADPKVPTVRSIALRTQTEIRAVEDLVDVDKTLEIILEKLHIKSKQVFADALTDNAKSLVSL